ncbi:MAG: hypothetical protein WDW36_009155 [Sanguina aurantia]
MASDPPPTPPGSWILDPAAPGVCAPVTITLAPYQAYYWCGWDSKFQTTFSYATVNAANATKAATTSSSLMRQSVLKALVLPNVTDWVTASAAPTLLNSNCSGASNPSGVCNLTVMGFAFGDPICLLVINAKPSKLTVRIRLNNYFSADRYFGTVFSLVFVIAGGAVWMFVMCWKFYYEWHHTTYVGGHNMNVNHLKKNDPEAEEGGPVAEGAAVPVSVAWIQDRTVPAPVGHHRLVETPGLPEPPKWFSKLGSKINTTRLPTFSTPAANSSGGGH